MTTDVTLNSLIPRWEFRERHSLPVPPDVDAVQALEQVTFGELPLFRTLLLLGSFGRFRSTRDEPFLQHLVHGGFSILSGRPGPLIVGTVTRTGEPRGAVALGDDPVVAAETFTRITEPGLYKAAFDVTTDGTRLCTETRVVTTSPQAHARFARYWALIRVPSGLIRREWLAAARRRAVEQHPAG